MLTKTQTDDELDIPPALDRRKPAAETVVTIEQPPVPAVVERSGAALTPMDMIDRAVSQGASIEILERLMALRERWEIGQSRKAFDEALSSAKSNIPIIFKNRTVDFTSQKGRTNYRHEDLAEIARTIDPVLAKHGLSYRFRTQTEGGTVSVTCIVSHRDGHSEENSLAAGYDLSGNKNPIQAIGSSITYLQRYTLKAALGLAASGDDDASAAGGEDGGNLSARQIDAVRTLIVQTGADIGRYCKYMKVQRIEDIAATEFDRAIAALEAKQRKQQ